MLGVAELETEFSDMLIIITTAPLMYRYRLKREEEERVSAWVNFGNTMFCPCGVMVAVVAYAHPHHREERNGDGYAMHVRRINMREHGESFYSLLEGLWKTHVV